MGMNNKDLFNVITEHYDGIKERKIETYDFTPITYYVRKSDPEITTFEYPDINTFELGDKNERVYFVDMVDGTGAVLSENIMAGIFRIIAKREYSDEGRPAITVYDQSAFREIGTNCRPR